MKIAIILPGIFWLCSFSAFSQRCAVEINAVSNPNTHMTEQLVLERNILQIPVVVHVVWKTMEENISEAQIQSQLEVLNEDFQAQNVNLSTVPEEFVSLIANPELQFCLATVDPSGAPTNGITRTQTAIDFIGTAIVNDKRAIHFTDEGGKDAWPISEYVNIWVGRRQFFLGEASFPWEIEEFPEGDGLIIDPYYFGRTGLALESAPFNLGRTVTHEMGHYLGLRHLNGPQNSSGCEVDDGLEDTPLQAGTYIGECPEHPAQSCGSNDLFVNFMALSNDACLAMFTPNQKQRMLSTLNNERAGLAAEGNCNESTNTEEELVHSILNIYPNPAINEVFLHVSKLQKKGRNVELWSSAGSLLLNTSIEGSNLIRWNVTNLNQGIYFIKISDINKIIIKKLIITR